MKSETIRKNLESEIVVSWTDENREDQYRTFCNDDMESAIKLARKIDDEKGDLVLWLAVELVVSNSSEEESNVVLRQEIPFNVF